MNKFEDYFSHCFTYYFDDKSQSKVKLMPYDKKTTKVCVFCGKTNPAVTFRKIAHIIPYGLGNRLLRYRYECDACNDKFGQLLDNNLINYLSFTRIFSRKKGTKIVTKLRCPGSSAYFESNSETNQIAIKCQKGDPAIIVNKLPDNKILYKIKAPPANPVSVAKSLARMALMALPFEEASGRTNLIKWINGDLKYLPKYFKAFMPGTGLRYTTLILYRKIPHIMNIGDYYVQFQFGCFVFSFQIPTESMLCPKNLIPPPNITCNVELVVCKQDDIEFDRWEGFEFAYEKEIVG